MNAILETGWRFCLRVAGQWRHGGHRASGAMRVTAPPLRVPAGCRNPRCRLRRSAGRPSRLACPGTPTAGCRRRPPWARMGIAAGAGRRAGEAVRRAGAAGCVDVAGEGRRGVGDDQVAQGIDVLVAVRDAVLQPVAGTRLIVAGPVSCGEGSGVQLGPVWRTSFTSSSAPDCATVVRSSRV